VNLPPPGGLAIELQPSEWSGCAVYAAPPRERKNRRWHCSQLKIFAALLLALVIIIAVFVMTASMPATAAPRPAVAAAPCPAGKLCVTAVGALDTKENVWPVTFSNGMVLKIELRAFESGQAPSLGPVSNFSDQSWFPIVGYYGYATFTQNGVTYHGHR